jgi:alpha-beta hydrolase superfamily lysophospholipase
MINRSRHGDGGADQECSWSGRGIQFHRFIEPLVKAGYTAIAFDGPAHGSSDGRNTSYFEFTDVVRAFFDPELGLHIRGVVAHSFGAAAAINGLARQTDSPETVLIAPALMLRRSAPPPERSAPARSRDTRPG